VVVQGAGAHLLFNDDHDDDDSHDAVVAQRVVTPSLSAPRVHTEGPIATAQVVVSKGVVNPVIAASESAATKSKGVKPVEGGGARRGFGTLLVAPQAALEAQLADKKAFSFDYHYDGAADAADAPCVSLQDTNEEALRAERMRALSILSGLGLSGEALTGSASGGGSVSFSTEAIEAVPSDIAGADLGRLKSIFHREGGVWFGDDGGLEETVVRGKVDALFLEAERQGIDVRRHDQDQGSDGGGSKSMAFNFFGDSADSAPTVEPTTRQPRSQTPVVAAHTVDDDVASLPDPASLPSMVAVAMLFRRNRCS
jgi:hypothetical protein